jgi:hypothetical protein
LCCSWGWGEREGGGAYSDVTQMSILGIWSSSSESESESESSASWLWPLTGLEVPLELLWGCAPAARPASAGAALRSLLWRERVAEGEWW